MLFIVVMRVCAVEPTPEKRTNVLLCRYGAVAYIIVA